MKLSLLCLLAFSLACGARAEDRTRWQAVTVETLKSIDDDIDRNSALPAYFEGIQISEYRFSENGFDWHLIRFASVAKPDGPLWMVPHDDENAAFDAMIATIKHHGGLGIAVNSGPGSLRLQAGDGICGVQSGKVSSCDPNRNFDAKTPLFTAAFLSQRRKTQPVIALHTNSPGFTGDGHGGRGEITILDTAAYQRGQTVPRRGGIFAVKPTKAMANYDSLGLTAYLARNGKPGRTAEKCGQTIAQGGVHFWHERVGASDGSMSNYLALNYPEIGYFNAESRAEAELAVAAERHKIMVQVYLKNCVRRKN